MQIKKMKIFSYDELSDSSKEKACANFLEGADFPWWSECRDSLREFCNHFGVSGLDYQIGAYSPSYATADAENSHFRGLKLADFADPDKLASTGYCEEFFMFEQFYNEWKRTGSPLLGFMFALAEGCKSIQRDMEYHQSQEYAEEMIILNEYFYTEDGEPVNFKYFEEVA